MKKIINFKGKALFISKKKNNFKIKIQEHVINELLQNEVLIKSKFTSLNYKDILLINGGHGLVRKFPHVPGIDIAGIVVSSRDKNIKIGEPVFVIAKPLGVESYGGYGQYVKIKSEWLVKAKNLKQLKQSMIFGTNGFTALVVINKILKNKRYFLKKPILITGGNSGVGLILIKILSKLGFSIHVSLRNTKKKNKIKKLGAEKLIKHKMLVEQNSFPFLKKTYSGVIDCVGGEFVNSGLGLLNENGVYFSVGNSAGNKATINILPFILRGINIVGINAENIKKKERLKIIKLMFKFSNYLEDIIKEFKFKNILSALKYYKNRKETKKILINF